METGISAHNQQHGNRLAERSKVSTQNELIVLTYIILAGPNAFVHKKYI